MFPVRILALILIAIVLGGGWAGSIPGEFIIDVTTPHPNPPPLGGCCTRDGLGGYSCTDGLQQSECNLLGGRYTPESAQGAYDGCAIMSPPCGQGACCSPLLSRLWPHPSASGPWWVGAWAT